MSRLADVVAAVDPALAPYAVDDPQRGEWEGRGEWEAPAAGQAGNHGNRAFTMEAVYEGFLMHYREPRAFAGMDPDLRLLAGDALYALGLERLAETGDLAAVAELADLISLCARAEAEGRHHDVPRLWEATLGALSPAGGPGARAAAGTSAAAPDLARSSQFPHEHQGS